MTHRFTIYGKLPSMNQFITANRTNVHVGNNMKKGSEAIIIIAIRQHLKKLQIENPIHIQYTFWESSTKRDLDNVASFAMKVIQDSLVKSGVIANDGWKNITSFSCEFGVDKDEPRIEVELVEVED